MKRFSTISIALLALLLTATGVLAQGGPNQAMADKARHQMQQAEQMLDRAREAVRASNSPMAELALQQAMTIMESSRKSFQNRNYLLAHQLAKKALERAQQAISAARQTEENANSVLNKLEQVQQLLERVQDAVGNDSGHGLKAMLESARTNLDRAWEFYHANQLRAAWKMANQVENALRKMLRAAEAAGNAENSFRHRFQTMTQIMDRAEAAVAGCESESALRLMEQARQTLRQAEELGQSNRYGAGLKAMQQARRLAERAARECSGGVDLESRLERMNADLDRLREQVRADDDAANRLIKTVRDQLRLASDMIGEKNDAAATAALKAAQLTLRQLERYLRSGEI